MDIKLKLVQLTHSVLTKLKRGGSFPGQLALAMDENFIDRFTMPPIVICVTGTNGKTSTANLIAESLRSAGLSVMNNRRGDNLKYGIATLLAANSNSNYEIHYNAAVIEIDELTLYRQFKHLKPTHLVITNFFRDQLDRAGEMETIIRKIEEVTEDFSGHLILNGDDPNVVRIADHAKNAKAHFYGVKENEVSQKTTDEASEGKFCPRCNAPLIYDYYQYSHIGSFHCPNDDFGKHIREMLVDSIDYKEGTFTIHQQIFHPRLCAIYNIYNCAAVLLTMKLLNLDLRKADKVFKEFLIQEGRNELFTLNEPCVINLIKNPTGANEVMKYILADDEEMNVCIFLNDGVQDGCDVSWIWDAHFERLNKPNIKEIICGGTRAYDMALRLKYEGLEDKIKVFEDMSSAIHYLNEANTKSYVMSTYTALHKARAILEKEAKA
ncbi:MAG: DUF1727 domain-containing protein [Solobacterium sp.]|nr:DUF1727 domain-containing protein [Solobacterium sp.]